MGTAHVHNRDTGTRGKDTVMVCIAMSLRYLLWTEKKLLVVDKLVLSNVAFPLKQASLDSVHEKNVRHGHINAAYLPVGDRWRRVVLR